jgi:cystathionine gamma-lyase
VRYATKAILASAQRQEPAETFSSGPQFASTYIVRGDPHSSKYAYGRDANPTWSTLEAAITTLEGAQTLVFASGMAATAAVLHAAIARGSRAIIPAEGYFNVRRIAEDFAVRGIDLVQLPSNRIEGCDFSGVSAVWIETPSNPFLEITDIARVAERVHASGAILVVDNTAATCVGQDAIGLGADVVIASDSKSLCGHSDLILGHAATNSEQIFGALLAHRTLYGAIPGPFEAWLAQRSLATVELRVAKQSANALAIASALAADPRARAVRYPGLHSHERHDVAARQMRYFGPMLTFDLETAAAADAFLNGCKLIKVATSFGGVHTTAERRARWGSDSVSEGLIRLSAGCEDEADILEDVMQALDSAIR